MGTSSKSYNEYSVQHELRSPLTIILGMLNFLNEESLTSKQHEYINHIAKSAEQLLLVADKLALLE